MANDKVPNDVDEVPDGEAARGSGEGIDGVDGDARKDGNGPLTGPREDLQDDLGTDPTPREGEA